MKNSGRRGVAPVFRWTAGLAIALAACVTVAAPLSAYVWRLPPGVAPPPVPADNPMSEAKVELGHRLFYDADLSVDGAMSCATCHEQRRAFTDSNRTHPGVHGDPGRRNIMALANVGYLHSLTWGDPTPRTLEAQVLVPVQGEHPVEMGMAGQPGAFAERLGSDPCYRRAFAAAFPENKGRIDIGTVSKALAAFERTLISFDAPYDRYRRGDRSALSPQAVAGRALFESARFRCASCHAGPMFTDAARPGVSVEASFHNLDPAAPAGADAGLGEITHKARDVGRFRTPSLRNVALSAPYLHDGSAATLPQAIQRHFPRGGGPDPRETDALVAFLEALSDRQFVSDPRFALPKAQCPS